MEGCVEIKIEPAEPLETGSESSQDGVEQKVLPSEQVHVKCEPVDFGDDEKYAIGVEKVAVKVEEEDSTDDDAYSDAVQGPVELEPTFYKNECESLGAASLPPLCDDSPSQSEAGPSNRICFNDIKRSWFRNEQYVEQFSFADDQMLKDLSDYDTDTSISDSSDDEKESHKAKAGISAEDEAQFYFGRNNVKWSKIPVNTTSKSSRSSDIPPDMCRPRDLLLATKRSPYHIWKYFMNDILRDILKWTNIKIAEIRSHFKTDSRPDLQDLDRVELEAFFGILMFGALVKSNHHHPNSIFENCVETIPIFLVTISKDRFIVILNCLQFGDPTNDDVDPHSDRNIGLLYERALSRCVKLFNGSQCATILEIPVLYYGDNLPEEYEDAPFTDGFKLVCLCDSATCFFYSCYIPYKDLSERDFTDYEKKLSVPTQIALLLTKPLHGTNKNITCDKRFTSLELIQALYKAKLTCVGTIKKRKMEIPVQFLPSEKREAGSVLYGYQENVTLMSYMRKKKGVIIASSKHHEAETTNSGHPAMLDYYRSTIQYYVRDEEPEKTTARRTKLLSMALFYKFLDITMYNTHILFQLQCNKNLKQYQTMQKLAQMLVYNHVVRRVYDVKVPFHLRVQILKMMSSESTDESDKKKETCATCPPNRKRKTSRKCVTCQRYLCRKCSHVMCIKCNLERAARF